MIKDWLRPVEQIILSARGLNASVVGFTELNGPSGVDILCDEVAEALFRSGIPTLLIRLAARAEEPKNLQRWTPGSAEMIAAISTDPRGFDLLTAPSDPEARFLFNNLDLLRTSFGKDLKAYKIIVVELPAVQDEAAYGINAVSVAAACDAVYLVCRTGQSTLPQVREAAKSFRSGGVEFAGTILNDTAARTPGSDIIRGLQRWRKLAPRLSQRLQRRVARSDLLN